MLVPILAINFLSQAGAIPVMRLEQVVQQIGKRSGKPLSVSPALKDEVVVVIAPALSDTELLKRLADVCRAEWQSTSDGLRLARSSALTRKIEANDRARRVALVNAWKKAQPREFTFDAKSFARRLSSFYAKHESDAELDNAGYSAFSKQRDALVAEGPTARLAAALARALPPEAYIDLPLDEVRCFAFQPTAREAILPEPARAAWKQFLKEQAAIEGQSISGANDVRLGNGVYLNRLRLNVTVNGSRSGQGYAVNTQIWNPATLRVVLRAQSIIELEPTRPAITQSQTPCRYRLGEPIKSLDVDPLMRTLGELPELVKASRRDFVGRFSDTVAEWTTELASAKTTGEVWSALAQSGHELHDDGKTLTLLPADESLHRFSRTSRADLRTLVETASREKRVSIPALAEFASRNPRSGFVLFAVPLVEAIVPGLMSGSMDYGALRLYNTLRPEERARFAKSYQLPFRGLNLKTRAEIEQIFFRRSDAPTLGGLRANTFLGQVPEDAMLTGDVYSEPMVLSVQAGRRSMQSLTEVAREKALLEWKGERPEMDALYPACIAGLQTGFSLSVSLTEQFRWRRNVTQTLVGVAHPTVPFSQLPAETMRFFDARYDVAKREYARLGTHKFPPSKP